MRPPHAPYLIFLTNLLVSVASPCPLADAARFLNHLGHENDPNGILFPPLVV